MAKCWIPEVYTFDEPSVQNRVDQWVPVIHNIIQTYGGSYLFYIYMHTTWHTLCSVLSCQHGVVCSEYTHTIIQKFSMYSYHDCTIYNIHTGNRLAVHVSVDPLPILIDPWYRRACQQIHALHADTPEPYPSIWKWAQRKWKMMISGYARENILSTPSTHHTPHTLYMNENCMTTLSSCETLRMTTLWNTIN